MSRHVTSRHLQLSTLSEGVEEDTARETHATTSPMRFLYDGFGVANYIPPTVCYDIVEWHSIMLCYNMVRLIYCYHVTLQYTRALCVASCYAILCHDM